MSDSSDYDKSFLETHYPTRYIQLSYVLENVDSDPTDYLADIESDLASFDALADAQKLMLVEEYLPKFVRTVIERKYKVDRMRKRVNEFLKRVIEFAVPRLNKDFPSNFDTVRRLLHKEREFYYYSNTSQEEDEILKEAILEDRKNKVGDPEVIAHTPEFANLQCYSQYCNWFYFYNINYFGILGGFKQLLLFLASDPRPALSLVNKSLVVFEQVTDYMERILWCELAKQAIDAAVLCVLSSSEEEIRTFSKAEVQNLVKHMENLSERFARDEKSQHGEAVELFRLDLSFKCIKSPYLEKRINGLIDIIDIIDTSKNREDEMTLYGSIYHQVSWLSAGKLIEWLNAHDLLEIIFGEKSHPELVKRSGPLLKLLYQKSMFTRANLDEVWAAAFSKHETERNVIIVLFAEIVPTLKTQDIQHFFTKISSLPLTQIDSHLLNLLNVFVKQSSYQKATPHRPIHKRVAIMEPEVGPWQGSQPHHMSRLYQGESRMSIDPPEEERESEPSESAFESTQALELLWRYWQQKSIEEGLSKTLAAEALHFFQDLVCHYTKVERVTYAVRCIENIQANVSVISSLQTLKEILSTYSSCVRITGSSEDTCPALIERFDRSHHLLSKVYGNFLWVKKEFAHRLHSVVNPAEDRREDETRADTNSSSNSLDSKDLRNYADALASIQISIDQDCSYYDEISKRLDFLRFIYSNYSESMLPKHVSLLWNVMVINAFTQREQDEFFKWFSEVIVPRHGVFQVLSEDTVHMFFIDVLLTLDSRYLTSAAMTCFEKYFVYINRLHGLLCRGEYGEELEIRDINLLGMDALWEHVLQARNSQVSQDACTLLKKLYRGLAICDLPIQQDLLRKCMDNIKSGAQTMDSEDYDSVTRIDRALGVLSEFIEEFEGPTQGDGPSITIQVQDMTVSSEYPKTFQLKLHARTKVAEARKLICEKLTPPRALSEVYIAVQGKPLDAKAIHQTLRDLKIPEQARVMVTLSHEQYDMREDNDVGMPEPLDMAEEHQSKVSQLREAFGHLSDEVIAAALKQSGWLSDDAAELLINEESVAELQKQIKDKLESQKEGRLSVVLSNTKEYFDLLFHLLGLGNNVLSGKIWKLLTQIPVNQDLYESIKSFHSDWNELMNQHCFFKLLYSLQIVNSFIVPPAHPITHEEVEERAVWKSHFIQKGGFEHLYKILLGWTKISVLPREQQLNNAKCIGFLLNVVKTFLQAALMTEPSHTLRELYNPQVSPLRRSGSKEVDAIFSPFSDSDTPDQCEQEFPEFVRQLSGSLATHVLDMVKFPELVDKLLDLTDDLSKMQLEAETVYVIENALGLLLPIVVNHPEAIKQLFSRDLFEGLFISALQSQSEGVRKSFYVTFKAICQAPNLCDESDPPCALIFLRILLKHLPKDSDTPAAEFFELTCDLVKQLKMQDEELLDTMLGFLLRRELVENRHLGNQDMAFSGYMWLVNTLLDERDGDLNEFEDLADFTYRCLFDMPSAHSDLKSNGPPMCKHPETRKRAFALLLTLTQRSRVISSRLLQQLSKHHPEAKSQSLFDSDISLKSASGFVGLKNFGCTCYLNSLLQQLFMMPSLRTELLSADVKLAPGEEVEENILYHLQLIFANLKESEKQYYTPMKFVRAFRDQEGQVLNVLVQQDVDEFFNLLCDRLENMMKHTKHQKLLRNLMGGTVADILTSSEPDIEYRSEKEEQFMRLSLEIKNKKNLSEALDLFIIEDSLEGENKYFCEQYNRKINAKKRVLIDSLSNTVIIHLKRFAFDFTTMQRFKINDYCEFPMELDLKPWCKVNEARGEAYYQYKLMGILVHSGIAEAGHYYSLICDRDSGRWYEFDDHTVKEFLLEDLKEECFGGTGYTSANSVWGAQSFQRSRSAYMLVYERVKPIPVAEESPEEIQAREVAIRDCKLINKLQDNLQAVWADNMEFLRDRQYFDQTYHHFLKAFVDNFPLQPVATITRDMSDNELILYYRAYAKAIIEHGMANFEENSRISPKDLLIYEVQNVCARMKQRDEEDIGLKLVKMAVQYAFELGLRAKQTELLREWMHLIMKFVPKHGPAAVWMLKKLTPEGSNSGGVVDLLMDERQVETREVFARLLTQLLRRVHDLEHGYFLATEEPIPQRTQSYDYLDQPVLKAMYSAASARFIKIYVTDLLNQARRHWKRFEDYFRVMGEMISMGADVLKFLHDLDLVYNLLEFFMNCSLPFSEDATKVAMGDQRSEPEMQPVIDILSKLVRTAATSDMQKRQSYPHNHLMPGGVAIILSQKAEALFSDPHVIDSLINQRKIEPIQTMLEYLAFESNSFSKIFLERLLLTIIQYKTNWFDVSKFLRLTTALLRINDQWAASRAENLFKLSLPLAMSYSCSCDFLDALCQARNSYLAYTGLIIVWLSEMLSLPTIRTAAFSHRRKLDWIRMFLQYDVRYLQANQFTDYKGSFLLMNEALPKTKEVVRLYAVLEVLPGDGERKLFGD